MKFGFNTPFAEQLDFFRRKLNLPSERWDDIQKAAHDRAFIVAGAMKADLVEDLRESIDKAMKTYPEETARRYYAEPGASEHQTGLSLDAWDGRNRGTAFARTPQAAWLARHAVDHGFIVRYPLGKTAITGYAWESWHLRWVGTEVSAAFTSDPSLTLEEFLGLA